jgi:hypothetical protein
LGHGGFGCREEGFAWGVAGGGDDGGNLVEEAAGKLGSAGGCLDCADGAAHQAGDATERGEEDPFFPHFALDRAG